MYYVIGIKDDNSEDYVYKSDILEDAIARLLYHTAKIYIMFDLNLKTEYRGFKLEIGK